MRKLITILGPTACGKTTIATALAARIDGEIISADSRQVYRRMDIGTGKDLSDYVIDGKAIPYHLIDICEPGTKYNLFQYQHDCLEAYNDIVGRNRQPILCGGTGLYLESVLGGYSLSPVPQNPELRQRLEGKSLEELTQMLTELKRQTGSNMHNQTDVDTAQRAIRAIEIEDYGLEYKYVTEYVIGAISFDEMFSRLEIAIHQFAKRQMTWFRGMERRGFHIHWVEAARQPERPTSKVVDEILELGVRS